MDLYPVGICYSENTDEEQVDKTGNGEDDNNDYTQNLMYSCAATDDGFEACKYRMGAGCSGRIYKYDNECYPCNGADDQCECEVGGKGMYILPFTHIRFAHIRI